MRQGAPLRLVVLGATGFVGQALLRRLAAEPREAVEVRALVRGGPGRLAAFPFVAVVPGSLPDLPEGLLPRDPHVVCHLATKQVDTDGAGFAVNLDAAGALVGALGPETAGVLYASSISVYGQGPQEGTTEEAPVRPATALARSRAAVERLLLDEVAVRAPRASVLCLRTRFTIGVGDRFTLPALARMVRGRIQVGSGRQAFTVIDVDDYAEVLVRLARRAQARHEASEEPLRAPLHVGYREPLPLASIAASLREALGARPPWKRVPGGRWLPRLLRIAPGAGAARLATRLELIGQPHYVSVEALAAEVGADIVDGCPKAALDRAVTHLVAGMRE